MARKKAAPDAAPKKAAPKVQVVAVDDDVFANAYGGCYQAKIGSWTGEKRSSRERAEHDGAAHLASK